MGIADTVNNALSYVMDPVLNIHPLWGLLLLTLILGVIITLAYKYFSNQDALKSLKEETKAIQKEMKESKDNPTRLLELQKKSLEKSMESFKHSIKPMLITLLPMLAIVGYLNVYYTRLDNPKLFLIFGWLGTYIIFSLIFNIILRKLLKVH